ncbi:hypothetical protein Q31b_39210 [Novipirellula aureliae]|uniref:Uncharacterized protein n=1 Tax=Novipirellula aureliae TaxID=2527966 RepID=A0A5C6DNH8_9BACT|nr:hypothetical protein Q31b_39210 [Novipirellula aureliae]
MNGRETRDCIWQGTVDNWGDGVLLCYLGEVHKRCPACQGYSIPMPSSHCHLPRFDTWGWATSRFS